jgi:hypothetical protein
MRNDWEKRENLIILFLISAYDLNNPLSSKNRAFEMISMNSLFNFCTEPKNNVYNDKTFICLLFNQNSAFS